MRPSPQCTAKLDEVVREILGACHDSLRAIVARALEQNAFGTCALKMGIFRLADVAASSAHEPSSSTLANHYFELAAFHAIGATGQLGHAIG
jgi:hypothetical protein